jgi:outer membrane protein
MKKIIALLAIATIGFTANLNAQKKNGHINAQEVLKEVPGYAASEKEMERYRNSKVTQLQDLQKNVQGAYDKYMTEKATLPKSIQKSREQEIQDMQLAAQQFETKAQKQIEEKYIELMEPLTEQLNKAIKDVAKTLGYAYILDSSQGVLLYFDGGDDLSVQVIAQLKKNAASAAVQSDEETE